MRGRRAARTGGWGGRVPRAEAPAFPPGRAGVRALAAAAAGGAIPASGRRTGGAAPGRGGRDGGMPGPGGLRSAGQAGCPPRPGAPSPAATPSRRAALAGLGMLAGLGALVGCGFAPALAPGGRGRVAIEAPETRAGFALRGRLLDRLGAPGADAPYRLAVALDVEPEIAAVDPAQVTTRLRLDGVARYALSEAATGRERLSGSARAFAAYDAAGTSVSLGASARDAEDRLATILADRIAARLLAADLP